MIEEDEDVVCPICKTLIIDAEDGLISQPSCPHVHFVYANGEAFEYDPEGLEERLGAEQKRADEDGESFDEWEWLLAQCDERDVILEHNDKEMACGALSFKVWVGIRNSLLTLTNGNGFSSQDQRKYFHPTSVFVKWIQARFVGKLIYDVGSGMGHVGKALSNSGFYVTALDLQPRAQSEFPVVQGDGTTYPFEKDAVVMLCRPSHDNRFVFKTILRALTSGVRTVIYVGLQRNVRADLGGYHKQFTKRKIRNIGQADEEVWEMSVSRIQANANLRRGSIPPLSSDFSH